MGRDNSIVKGKICIQYAPRAMCKRDDDDRNMCEWDEYSMILTAPVWEIEFMPD